VIIPYMESTISDLSREWLENAGLNAAAAARRAGVSASTMHRILNGQVDPLVGTLEEIAIASGLEIDITARPASNPLAAMAARSILEDDYSAPVSVAADVERWMERLVRIADGDDPIEIVQVAGRMSAPFLRPNASIFIGMQTLGRIASVGDATGGRWALSGAAGINLAELDASLSQMTILWCEDVRSATNLMTDSSMKRSDQPQRAVLAVVEAEQELFFGSFKNGLVHYAAPIQIMIDCMSIGGRVAQDAREEMSTW
jgi:transcriptional regulator with XRE-family HTH domain